MPATSTELLLELFSEEIPARMQARAAEDLQKLVLEGLKAQGLAVGAAMSFATPRRLTLVINGVPAKSPGVSEERKGPRVGAPEQALAGFLKGAGLARIEDAEIVSDPKKGDFYVARIEKAGRPAAEIIAEVVPLVMAKFPWPKSQRWGAGDFQWVRPLQSIVCLLGGKVVPFEVAGLKSGNLTRGHRFHGNVPFEVKSFEDYGKKLKEHKVLLPASERAQWIGEQARAIAAKEKLELVDDEALTNENAGLTEWPTVLMGTFEKEFLAVPGECLTTSMKMHQKCFSLRDPKTRKLTNKFLLVSNLIAPDGGKEIVHGNEKVIRARLSDAKFFWDQDLKKPLDEMASALKSITFHEKLGTQAERVERVAELAHKIAGAVDADPDSARRAAQLAKADLVSGMVGEFPELQGLMGRYYAEVGKIKPEIARAIELHYKPRGAGDTVPLEADGDAVACAVALADKIDTLVGFWAIGEKPSGSGDPYQLRRAALGVIRIVLENDFRVPLATLFQTAVHEHLVNFGYHREKIKTALLDALESHENSLVVLERSVPNAVFARISALLSAFSKAGVTDYSDNLTFLLVDYGESYDQRILEELGNIEKFDPRDRKDFEKQYDQARAVAGRFKINLAEDLQAFFFDRLKVYLRDKGARHDLIDAVLALGGQDDLALIVKRVEALGAFLTTDDGVNLLAGVKRASNILAIEEKKDKASYNGTYDVKLLKENEELALAAALESVKQDAVAAINVENFTGAMNALAELRKPVDAFFEKVTVNADDAKLRLNRLRLLSEIRAATQTVADFSKIAG